MEKDQKISETILIIRTELHSRRKEHVLAFNSK